ncbi:Nuclear control of ATPase protein 2 [Dispira simplex]|nr:Nuclear control of ATPase protein 2 [Dispira simplex]
MGFVEEQYGQLIQALDAQFVRHANHFSPTPGANDESPLFLLQKLTPAVGPPQHDNGGDTTPTVGGPQHHTARLGELRDWLNRQVNETLESNPSPWMLVKPSTMETHPMLNHSAYSVTDAANPASSTSLAWENLKLAASLTLTAGDHRPSGLSNMDHLESKVRELAEWHEEWCYLTEQTADNASISLSTMEDRDPADLFQWWLSARLLAGIYAHTMQMLLETSLPLFREIEYWESQQSSAVSTGLYLVATLPARLYGATKRMMGALSFHLPWARRTEHKNLGVRATGYLGPLFPDLWHTLKSLPKVSFEPLLLIRLARQEILRKQALLITTQNQLNTCMGLFSTYTTHLRSVGEVPSLRGATGTPSSSIESAPWTALCTQLVTQATVMRAELERVNLMLQPGGNTNHTVDSSLSTSEDPSLANLLDGLVGITHALHEHRIGTNARILHLYSPSFLTRSWLPIITGLVVGRTVTQMLYGYRGDMTRWLKEVQLTAQDYMHHWVLKPLREMWATIRHRNERLALASAESLHSDLDSLERMVVHFAQERGTATSRGAIEQLAEQVRRGNLDVVLLKYEQDLQHPIKGALFGDLVQTVLIQVQKTKVDLQLAMTSLDKLLKANELNFAFLAVAPALVVLYVVGYQTRLLWRKWRGAGQRKVGIRIRTILRDIERILNLCSSLPSTPDHFPSEPSHGDTGVVPYQVQGLLLCLTYRLRDLAQGLPNSPASATVSVPLVSLLWEDPKRELPFLRRRFLEDVQDLENASLPCHQKLWTIARMYRTYQFI